MYVLFERDYHVRCTCRLPNSSVLVANTCVYTGTEHVVKISNNWVYYLQKNLTTVRSICLIQTPRLRLYHDRANSKILNMFSSRCGRLPPFLCFPISGVLSHHRGIPVTYFHFMSLYDPATRVSFGMLLRPRQMGPVTVVVHIV